MESAQSTGVAATAKAIFDLSRGKQALLSVGQPALGAVLAAGGLPSARVILLGLVGATAGYLAVFSLNDVLDHGVDRAALSLDNTPAARDIDITFIRHPIAQGAIGYGTSVAWVLSLAAVAGVCAYLLNPLCLALFAASVSLEVTYCLLRSVTWLKTFVSGVMVGLGGLAGWAAVAGLGAEAAAFFLFLALWEIAGRNLPNDLADLEDDSAVSIRTVATTFGQKVSSRAIAGGTLLTLLSVATLPSPLALRMGGLAAGVWSMGLPAARLWREPTSQGAADYFNRASLLPAILFAVAFGLALAGLW